MTKTLTTHTPGPWTVTEHLNILGADGIGVANAQRIGDWPLAEANARLIAKAPELTIELALLIEAIRTIGRHWDAGDLAAAVRSAEQQADTATALLAEIEGRR